MTEPKIKIETRDGQQVCVCTSCPAWYPLENPAGFKHARRCKNKKPPNKPAEQFSSWQYNVVDEYKSLSAEEIKEQLINKQLPFAVMMSQIEGDFNFGCCIRTANAMGASKVFYFGNKHYDKRSTTGTHHYTNVVYLSSLNDVKMLKNEYHFVGLENNVSKSTYNMFNYDWIPNTLLILGEENSGISAEITELCEEFVEIPMRGSVRSFNVASAASIAMYDYSRKFYLNRKI